MKKFATVITAVSLALPLAFAAPLAANAATKPVATKTVKAAKGTTYTIANKGAQFFSKAKTYHTKDASPAVYKGLVYADAPKVTFTKKGNLKSGTTYKVTRSLKTAATKTTKAKTFFYVKGQGWVLASALTKGPFQQAD
ncbi:hypothetical protein OQI89_11600 [Lentilactobacillus diolivorans]|uniref:Surface layer protein A domain-containing protein n=2 Tax=Lentilactobacillus diolivorans TaxID=179838 RepID=A0A0R1S4G9_9LACO|nr:hypothetical protein [Lentilactobacillus diolivorans]KRL64166.1 hypothetical protein FC85_GL001440 [Lentilactobacillus diolivorans DSM 14421]MDH5106498.1 hypothetical protein [Lentilactobacillus diolivorans]GEP23732.1 hypothetical protein LDI01_13250 [Lentilactobacillus diolivorans]